MALPSTPPLTWRKQDWAYERLRGWILSGHLAPLQRIDQEKLAQELGISRIPLRQALARLASEGLVVDRPHQRWVVARVSLPDARDVYGGREALEVMLAHHAASAVTPTDVAHIVELFEEQKWATQRGQTDRARELDRRFHNAIYAHARMPRSLEVLEQLRTLSDRYITMFLSDPDRASASLREHEAIVQALVAADAAAVRDATRTHIQRGLVELTGLLSTDEGNTE